MEGYNSDAEVWKEMPKEKSFLPISPVLWTFPFIGKSSEVDMNAIFWMERMPFLLLVSAACWKNVYEVYRETLTGHLQHWNPLEKVSKGYFLFFIHVYDLLVTASWNDLLEWWVNFHSEWLLAMRLTKRFVGSAYWDWTCGNASIGWLRFSR